MTKRASLPLPSFSFSGNDALGSSSIHHLFQFFSDLKERKLFRGNIHDLPGLWISALVAPVISHHKASKSSDLDPLPFLQTFLHPVEEGVDNDLGNLLCHIRFLRNLRNEFSLVHSFLPSSSTSPSPPRGEGWGEGIKVNDFEYIAPHF